MFTIFSQQILNDRLLLVIIGCYCRDKKIILVLGSNLNLQQLITCDLL